jgi:hypothetical protein
LVLKPTNCTTMVAIGLHPQQRRPLIGCTGRQSYKGRAIAFQI